MWPNPQFPADLVTFTQEILHGKLHFFAVEGVSLKVLYPQSPGDLSLKLNIFCYTLHELQTRYLIIADTEAYIAPCQISMIRSSRSQMFFKIGVLQAWRLATALKRDSKHRFFPVKFAKILGTPIFHRAPLVAIWKYTLHKKWSFLLRIFTIFCAVIVNDFAKSLLHRILNTPLWWVLETNLSKVVLTVF